MSGPTLTLFTTMKPFHGETARIQRNAIKSWLALIPRPEIIVFGDEPGVAEACREFGLARVSEVERAPAGPPYLDDVLEKAQRFASARILCYVNADILLTSDLLTALETVSRRLGPAVMVCAPHNMSIPQEIETSDPCWERRIRTNAPQKGPLPSPYGADIFIFPKGFYCRLPPLAMGQFGFDNVLLWRACVGGLPAVDLTDAVLAVHQHHGRTSHGGTSAHDPEQIARYRDSKWNRARSPWWQRHCWRVDVPFALRPDGSIVRRSRIPRVALLRAVTMRQCYRLEIHILEQTFYLRRRLKLYRWWRQDRIPDGCGSNDPSDQRRQ